MAGWSKRIEEGCRILLGCPAFDNTIHVIERIWPILSPFKQLSSTRILHDGGVIPHR